MIHPTIELLGRDVRVLVEQTTAVDPQRLGDFAFEPVRRGRGRLDCGGDGRPRPQSPFASFAGEHYFGISGPVPENAFGRSLPQQLSHLVGEFFDTVAEVVRRGIRHREVTGNHALDIPHEVRDAGGEDHPWRAEPRVGKGVLEAEGLNRRGALARSPRRSEILPHQLLDLIVRNPRLPGARRDGPPSA